MNWQADCESILRDVAGDDIHNVYLLNGESVERYDQRLASDGSGWTSRVCDLMLADCIGDQWTGRGFAAVIYPERCQDVQHTIGCVLHEAAHHLTYGDQQATSEPPEGISRELLSWIPEEPAAPISRPAWHQHESDFVRAAAHLAYRVGGVVESVRPRHLRFIGPYHHPPFTEDAFMQALAGELTRSDSIRDILGTPAPEAFTERWQQATQ